MNKPLEALLFDVDGTLADTERDGHRVAFNAAFDEYDIGWHWSVETYGELLAITGGKERMKHYSEHYLGPSQIPDNLDQLIPELHKTKTRHYTELLSAGTVPLRPGVERLLNEAREQGLRLAIATTTTPANVTALLSHTLGEQSIDWFEVIAAGDIVPAKKPAGDIYHYAMQKMNITPECCLAFEDSRNGILSAQDAGLCTLITINDYTREHDFKGAAIVLDNLGEPGKPFRVIEGDANNHDMVDCECLKYIHANNMN